MFNHASNASNPNLRRQPPQPHRPSNASLCSLRGDTKDVHPLRQNPPSIHESVDDYSSFDDIELAPPPSALTSRPTHYDPHEEDYTSSISNSHQKSLTGTFFDNCRPLVNRATTTISQHTSRTSFHSPTKSLASFIPSRSGAESSASQPKIRAGSKIFSDWFNGASGPVSLGIPSPSKEHPPSDSESDSGSDSEEEEEEEEEGEEMESRTMAGIFTRAPSRQPTSPDTTPKQQNPQPRLQPASISKTASSKFAWLLNTQKSATIPNMSHHETTYHNPSDELLNLNISQSLFPHGPVDPLAPSSFHDLLSTAERLLTRYQSSYRALSSALSDSQAEQSAQADELDEADTRIRHLKMQLDSMTARAADQEAQMQKMAETLTLERQKRAEEEEARKRSLALVRGPGCAHVECQDPSSPTRRKRTSNTNSDLSVDSGFESECDSMSEAASIFSRANGAMSPTDTLPSSAASFVEPDITPKKPQLIHRPSTYEKVLNGQVQSGRNGGWGCANCEGGSQSSVWGRLSQAREENAVLKGRIRNLEEGIEGALTVVGGPWGI